MRREFKTVSFATNHISIRRVRIKCKLFIMSDASQPFSLINKGYELRCACERASCLCRCCLC